MGQVSFDRTLVIPVNKAGKKRRQTRYKLYRSTVPAHAKLAAE